LNNLTKYAIMASVHSDMLEVIYNTRGLSSAWLAAFQCTIAKSSFCVSGFTDSRWLHGMAGKVDVYFLFCA